MQKVLCIKNDIHELCSLTQFLEKVGDELGLSSGLVMNLNLVLEEAYCFILNKQTTIYLTSLHPYLLYI